MVVGALRLICDKPARRPSASVSSPSRFLSKHFFNACCQDDKYYYKSLVVFCCCYEEEEMIHTQCWQNMRGLKQESWWGKIQNNHQMSIIIMNHQSDVHDIYYAEFGFDRSSGLCKQKGFNIPTQQLNGTISEPTQVQWIAMDAVHSKNLLKKLNFYFIPGSWRVCIFEQRRTSSRQPEK